MPSNMNSFFDELVEAKKAMETLPQVNAELAKALSEVNFVNGKLNDSHNREVALLDQLSALKDQLAAKEAALAQSTFQETETKNKLDMLLGSFKAVIGEASAAVELADPPTPPVVEPVKEAEAIEPYHSRHYDEFSEFTVSAPLIYSSKDQSATDPTQDATSVAETGSVERDASANVTDLPGHFTSGSGFTEAAREPDTRTYVAFDPSAPSNKPNDGRAYWEKPDTMTWRAWHASGGSIPYWIKSSDIAIDGTN